jgi:hypothetical protein
MNNIPFPSNDVPQPINQRSDPRDLPWKKLHPNEHMPMCFEVRSNSGTVETFPYSDFRGTKLIHAGHLIVNIFSMEKYQIVIEGRNLSELAKHLSLGRIHSFRESPKRNFETQEGQPHIEKISVLAL